MTNQDPQWNPAPPVKRSSSMNWGILAAIVVAIAIAGYVFGRPSASNRTPSGGTGGAHQASVTITGSGIETSRKFYLNAGDYLVSWTATPDSDVGCYHGATLDSTDVSVFETLASELLDNQTPKSGTTHLFGVEAADYYVDANSGCDWSFTFTQQ